MRKIVLVAAALALASPALAGPKDQMKVSMIGPQDIIGNATVNNNTTAAKWSVKGCKVQVQMKGVAGMADGDIAICIAEADVIAPPALPPPGGGNGVVILGEAKSGQLKVKADMTEIACGSTDNIQFNVDVKCYLDDQPYRLGGWLAACAAAGMAGVPNPAAAPDKLKANPTENVVLGLCQGFVYGQRIGPPASNLIAQSGARGFIILP